MNQPKTMDELVKLTENALQRTHSHVSEVFGGTLQIQKLKKPANTVRVFLPEGPVKFNVTYNDGCLFYWIKDHTFSCVPISIL